MTFYGTCNSTLFVAWVEKILIPELKAGQTIVMDNASFGSRPLREHKSQKTKELIESVGCTLIFLPPYSPDLNPIEKFWANMKRWINQNLPHMEDLHKAISFFFKDKRNVNVIYYSTP